MSLIWVRPRFVKEPRLGGIQ